MKIAKKLVPTDVSQTLENNFLKNSLDIKGGNSCAEGRSKEEE